MIDLSGGTSGTPVLPVVRVAIMAGGRVVDMALPVELPLREIIPAVRRLLPSSEPAEAVGPDAPTRLSLAPIGGAPFSLDASLDTVGVVDGDLLTLQPIPRGPAAPGIVEDVADAAVIFSQSRLQPWGIVDIRLMTRAMVLALILAATSFAVAQRIVTKDVLGLYAVSVLAAVVVVTVLVLIAKSSRSAVDFAVVAVVPVAAAFALAVPGDFGSAQVMLAAAGVAAWSLICMIAAERGIIFFTAATVVCTAVLAAAAVVQIWNLPLLTLGCGLIVAGLLITVQAAQFSVLLARLPMPVIPAPGDPAPSAPALRELRDLPRRVQISDAHQTGFIAGAVVLSVLGSLAIAARPESLGGWAWYGIVATSVAALLRARIWGTSACKAWLLAQPSLVSICLLVLFAVQERGLAALCVLVALAVLSGGFVIVAVNPSLAEPESYSLPMRRLVNVSAAAVDASLIPVMAYLVGLFSWVLDR